MPSILRDIVCAYRGLRATPGSALAAILTIALGTGVNTAVFAVAYGILFRPLPCPEPSRIIVVSVHAPNGNEVGVPLKEIDDWQRRLRTVQATGAYSVAEMTVRGAGEPRLIRTAVVTPSFFDVLRVSAATGRTPSGVDRDDWMVLAPALWGQAADSASLVGRSLTVGDRGLQASAVMAGGFALPADDVAAWIPAGRFDRIRLASGREIPRTFRLMARLKDGASVEQARDDVQRAFADTAPTRTERTRVRTLDDVLFGKVRPVLNALLAAAMLVLLVACGNVATLLVSRAVGRNRDLAVRVSLGASAWQLARAAVAESLLIAAAGSALGIGLAMAWVRLFVHTATGVLPRLGAVGVDGPILAAAVLVAAGVTLVCGFAPAVYATRSPFVQAVRGSRASAPPSVRLTRRLLIVAQIAMSIVLLSGAGLVARTVSGLLSDRAGADPDHALLVKLVLADTARFDLASRMPVMREVLRRVRALPGVEHAGIGTNVPPRISQIAFGVQEQSRGRTTDHSVYLASVTGDFFAAVGARVLEGRAIDAKDEQRDGPVIVLSQSAARLLSPGRSLVGRDLPWPLPAGAGKGKRPLVAGVVADVKYDGLDAPALAAIYTRWEDLPASVGHLMVRTQGDPAALVPAIRKTLRAVDPSLPVMEVRTLRQEYADSIADRRIRLFPAVAFAALATLIALVGLGGLLARAASERRRELAVRMVLGASPAGVVGIILREGALLTAAGVVLGLGAAAGASTWLRSLLYGVSAFDALTFAAVASFVVAAALVTAFLSARRAAAVEPLELLRSE